MTTLDRRTLLGLISGSGLVAALPTFPLLAGIGPADPDLDPEANDIRLLLSTRQDRIRTLYLRFWTDCTYPQRSAEAAAPEGAWIRQGLSELLITRHEVTAAYHREGARFTETLTPTRLITRAHDLNGKRGDAILRDQRMEVRSVARHALDLFIPTLNDQLTQRLGSNSLRQHEVVKLAQGDYLFWVSKALGAVIRLDRYSSMRQLRMRVDFDGHFELDNDLYFPRRIERRLYLRGAKVVRREEIGVLESVLNDSGYKTIGG